MRIRRTSALALAIVPALAVAAVLTPAAAAPAATRFYVDCSATAAGNGTVASPWNSLTPAAALTLTAGQQLLLRRGTTCIGTLQPTVAGATGSPVVLGAYGSGATPVINAKGAPAAVALTNPEHVVVQDLSLTDPGSKTVLHRGVWITAAGQVVSDVTVQRMTIRGVAGLSGYTTKNGGGVVAEVTSAGGRFSGLRILRNTVADVSRSGIWVDGGQGAGRPAATKPWPSASTGVLVQGNAVTRTTGDGIVTLGTNGAHVTGNVVSDGNLAGSSVLSSQGANCSAGIWAFNANNTLIERNEVYGYHFNGCDGTAYDVDYDQDNTVVQYNYSHDNTGGFLLLCGTDETRTAKVRFNLSVDDSYALNISPCRISAGIIGTLNGVSVYDNTFLTRSSLIQSPLGSPSASSLVPFGSFVFKNNVVAALTAQKHKLVCGTRCTNNLFWRVPASGSASVSANPKFAHGGLHGVGAARVAPGFRPLATSRAARAGVAIAGSPATDFFGRAVPKKPTIGFATAGG